MPKKNEMPLPEEEFPGPVPDETPVEETPVAEEVEGISDDTPPEPTPEVIIDGADTRQGRTTETYTVTPTFRSVFSASEGQISTPTTTEIKSISFTNQVTTLPDEKKPLQAYPD